MEQHIADQILKAVVDGVSDYREIAKRSGLDPVELVAHAEMIDRGIELMRGFYKYADENMKPAGLPAPRNPYFDAACRLEAQCPEYYAYEAVQRGNANRERSLWICGQFGLSPDEAEKAIDNVAIPWREENGWRTYVREEAGERYVLQDRPPVKLKRHLDRMRESLVKA